MSARQKELVPSGQLESLSISNSSLTFTRRFYQALCEPPIAGTFYDNGWKPGFEQALEQVNKVCKQRQICGHGMDHIVRTTQNAFFLSDFANAYFIEVQPTVKEQWQKMFSDANVLLPILAHDLGYASDNTQWERLNGKNHAHESTVIFDLQAANGCPKSAKLIAVQGEIFRRAIADEKEVILERSSRLLQHPNEVTPEEVFPLIVQAADNLDYFHADRIKELSDRPILFEENPYFFLADAVSSYKLTAADSSIQYEVQLKDAYKILSHAGSIELDFKLWRDFILKHYPKIFSLAETFGSICGTRFTIREK